MTMRVIAGRFKGRRLRAPTWEGLRPTSDKLRETLFNIIGPRAVGARLVDAFAGTGALGIEAMSLGAADVTFIEDDRRAQVLIGENLSRCGIKGGYAIIRAIVSSAFAEMRRAPQFVPFDIILLDPPYDTSPDEALGGAEAVLAAHGLIVLEHARRRPVPEHAGSLVRVRQVRCADSALSFYQLDQS